MRLSGGVASVGVSFWFVAGCAGVLASRSASVGPPPAPPDVLSGMTARQEGVVIQEQASMSVLADAPAVRKTRGRQARVAPRLLAQAEGAGLAPTSTQELQQQLVVSGAVEISAADVRATAAAVRAGAITHGATVVTDEVTGAKYGVHARFQLRLPPGEVAPFVAWLGTQGTLESSQLSASDVSREYYDEELRLRTLRGEMERLEKLMAEHPNAALEDVLAIEREMTRVRSEVESVEGRHRYLGDRVARATLDIHITGHDEVVAGAPEEKFILVAHGLASSFVDAGPRHRDRYGAGVGMLLGHRFDLTFDVLPARGADARSMQLTVGGALYSDFLGRGRRMFGNPYLGLRVGGGGVNGRGAFAYAGEVGVELVRHPHILVDLTARAMGLLYGQTPRSDIALQGLLGVGVPF